MNVSLLNPLYVSGATIKHLDCAIVNKKSVETVYAKTTMIRLDEF